MASSCPFLHLNGYKIANPTILARISDEELTKFFEGMGYEPHFFVAGFDNEPHASIHARFAGLLERSLARSATSRPTPRWVTRPVPCTR